MRTSMVFQMSRLALFLLTAVFVNAYQFVEITDLKEYNSKWLSMVPPQYVHNYTSKYNTAQRCNNKECQFYVYQYRQKKLQSNNMGGDVEYDQQDQQKDIGKASILLVAGMHGNQLIGPTALLYAYKQLIALNPYRIFFFPIANPSGFLLKKRETSNNVDPNRDFPFENKKTCYRVAATSILQNIFRQNQIDITISLHNGGTEIAWVWGSPSFKTNSHTSQQQIYQTIGKALKKYGGSNKILQPFKIGTMNEVVYPVQGGFEDWVYGASSQKDKFTANICARTAIQVYPQGMTNSLSFIWELGPHKTSPYYYGSSQGINQFANATNLTNGYISRAIRMLKQIVHIANPTINMQISTTQIAITLLGCSQAKVNLRAVKTDAQDEQSQIFIINDYPMTGSLKDQKYYPVHYFQTNLPQSLGIYYTYEFYCDQQWYNLGKTLFSQNRVFQNDGYLKVQKQPIEKKVWKTENQSIFMPVLVTVVIILIIVFSYLIYFIYGKIRQLSDEEERRKMKRKNKKQSQTQIQMKYQKVHNIDENNAQ